MSTRLAAGGQAGAGPVPLLFLPGAGASADFWRPAAAGLPGPQHFLAWPGLGDEAPSDDVRGPLDLVDRVLGLATGPLDLIAQSMGGWVALRAALSAPGRVRRLVLVATSGGLPMDGIAREDWRPDYYARHPQAARWIGDPVEDLSPRLARVRAPALLIWGADDRISPPEVGRRLQAALPCARLHVLAGGDHDLARTHADEVAALIRAHLAG